MVLKKLASSLQKLGKNTFLVSFAKRNAMQGKTSFFSHNRKKLQQFWSERDEKSIECYLTDLGQSSYLYEQIRTIASISKEDAILEVGCNVGRNLNYLYKEGFHNLYGIEINPNAISLMMKSYPEMYSNSNILVGPVEDKIKEIKSNKISLTFTMAVLQHIHPSSNFIFGEISRVTSKYILTIEREREFNLTDEFPRDYNLIFKNLGWKQLESKNADSSHLSARKGYILRMLQKDSE